MQWEEGVMPAQGVAWDSLGSVLKALCARAYLRGEGGGVRFPW